MAPRLAVPADDLYAQLDLPVDASPEAIDVAWRGLLRLHHPDVAGPAGLERAKRINVAHDWLSDPGLRARYDRERGLTARHGRVEAHGHARSDRSRTATSEAERHPAGRRATDPDDPAEAIARFVDRLSSLTADELDRLAAADPAPIAFGATIRRFLPEDRRIALEGVDAEIGRRLPADVLARSGTRGVIEAYAAELVLGSFLDDLLSEPFRERTRERLTRGWDAAVGQPRYGPNGRAVEALIRRLRMLDAAGVARLAATGTRERLGEEPWPPGVSIEDDEVLRVSSWLAGRDAAAAVDAASLDAVRVERARRAASRAAHLLVLRHAFTPAAFAVLTAPWRPDLVPDDRPSTRVRRPASA
ncbi:MAG: J domain-containing protein [Candidatus Limnocylindrales bacterium]